MSTNPIKLGHLIAEIASGRAFADGARGASRGCATARREVINDEVIMTSRDVTRNQKGGRFASRGTLQKIMVGTDVLRRAWNLE
jgi:hypothetical protein